MEFAAIICWRHRFCANKLGYSFDVSILIVKVYTVWFKKMDSISYVYISWTIRGMCMIYITFERGGPKFSNTTSRALAKRTAVLQLQLRTKWLLCSHVSRSALIHVVGRSFCLYTDSLFAQIGDSNNKCSSSLEDECWNEDETHSAQQSPTQF